MPVALGDVTSYAAGDGKSVVLLAPATATNSPPANPTDGLAMTEVFNLFTCWPSTVTLHLYSTAGSGTMTASGRLWGRIPNATGTPHWHPLGTGNDSTKGMINEGNVLGETSADKLRHCEPVELLPEFDRLYFEVVSIGGTSTSVTVELAVRKGF